jgi:uncharacterized protein
VFPLILAIVSLLQITPAQQGRVLWVPNPRTSHGGWVADPSHHLAPATLDSANALIATLERETSAEIAVAVVDSMSGLEAQEFATTLHRVWGVGKQGKNNGVLLLWNPVHHDVFISVGYGLEGAIPDRRAGRIRDDIVAQFRANHFDAGILTGVRELADAARQEYATTPVTQAETPQTHRAPPASPSHAGEIIGAALGALLAGIGGISGWRRWRRRRTRFCSKGHKMRLLGAGEEDTQLDKGAQVEEKLGSIDWDVWVCGTCGEVLRLPYKAIFTSLKECPQCKRRTLEEKVKSIVAATTGHGGRELVSRRCRNCQWGESVERDTPILVSSSGGSGSPNSGGGSGGGGDSGGSFGGGSAGGGGAGGRY